MQEKLFFNVCTVHQSFVCVDREARLVQRTSTNAGDHPVCAYKDNDAVAFFVVLDGQRRFISNIHSDAGVDFSDSPVLFAVTDNTDGSFSINIKGSFLSARRNASFAFVNNNLDWEHFFLKTSFLFDCRRFGISKLSTVHGTQVCLDDDVLSHRQTQELQGNSDLFAQPVGEDSLRLFVLKQNALHYVSSIDVNGCVSLSATPHLFAFVQNAEDQSISIRQNGLFWSAKDTGVFSLVPRNRMWEHLTLKPIDSFDFGMLLPTLVASPDDVLKYEDFNSPNRVWLVKGNAAPNIFNPPPRGTVLNVEPVMHVSAQWLDDFQSAIDSQPDFLALGDQHAVRGININALGSFKGINLAAPNQNLKQSCLIANRILERPNRLKFILIGLSPASLKSVGDRCRYLFNGEADTLEDALIDRLVSSISPVSNDVSSEPRRPTRSVDTVECDEESLRHLENLIDKCKALDVELVAVLPPSTVNEYSKKQIAFLRRLLSYLEKTLKTVDLTDMEPRRDSFEGMYLNENGEFQVGALLCARLQLAFGEKISLGLTYEQIYNLRSCVTPKEKERITDALFDRTIGMLKKRDKLNIGFVIYDTSMWCGDRLYNMFAQNPRYQTTVFLCLRRGHGELIKSDFGKGVELFKARGINVVEVRNGEMKIPKQDVLIYLTPYFKPLPKQFKDSTLTSETLIANIPYSLGAGVFGAQHIFVMDEVLWRTFPSSKLLARRSTVHKKTPPSRVIYSGAPKMDEIVVQSEEVSQFDWKMAQPDAVKIIWSPHWSVMLDNGSSTFRWNHEFFYEYAKAHPETSWVVKPHPNLLFSAVDGKIFPSIPALKEYFKRWDELPNAKVVTGGYYQSIFATSDGIINDSASFIIEYQYTHKPMLMLMRDTAKFNELGKAIIAANYHVDGRDYEGIANFIEDVLIKHNDTQLEARTKVFDENLNYRKENGMLASEKIFDTIDRPLRP